MAGEMAPKFEFEPNTQKVDETVFCGGIEAVQNQNLLCRLNIEYIVDLSGQEDDPTLSNNRQILTKYRA